MSIRNPRDANGPDGYPIDNAAFRRAANRVLDERREDARQARTFLKRLADLLAGTTGEPTPDADAGHPHDRVGKDRSIRRRL